MGKLDIKAEPGSQEIIVTREFDAPRDVLFQAMTDPKAIPEWWGPSYLTTVVEKMDVKKGGVWRFVQRDPEGNEYAFNGVYHEIVAPERMVYTFEWEGLPGHILMETVRFEEKNGKTIVIDQSVFQSVADRDGMLSNGMEDGAEESMDRLMAVVARRMPAKV